MKIKRMLIGALFAGILALAPSASGISISVSNDVGGFTEVINALDDDIVSGFIEIGPNSLSNSIKGSGDLKEDHWARNPEGDTAGVGVDIRGAESYNYNYYIIESPFEVEAGEKMEVDDAYYINAWARSFNARGNNAGVSTVLFDFGNRASLSGYSNRATSSKEKVSASQSAQSASLDYGAILTEAESFNEFPISTDDLFREKSEASTIIESGYIEDYSDSASASTISLEAYQSITNAKGKRINTDTRSMIGKTNAEVSTETFGALTNYKGTATKYNGIPPYTLDEDYRNLVEAQQSAHISGNFTSTSVAGTASKTRVSNYGDEYDLNMQAWNNGFRSSAYGTLGYYVNIRNPIANRIQGAVDASESGDTINVAEGTYNENVKIDKSLNVLGAGATSTIVDGGQSGSVFNIFSNNAADQKVNVLLAGMTIQGGSDSGIKNSVMMRLKDSIISGNTANYGGGIFSNGEAILDNVSITGNDADNGGGIFNAYPSSVILNEGSISGNRAIYGGAISNNGNLSINGGSITGNIAQSGGAIYNSGRVTINSGSIARNTADSGGAIYNDGLIGDLQEVNEDESDRPGTVTMNGGSITGNTAQNGGGIANYYGGSLELNGGSISGNTAQDGGGVYSYHYSQVAVNGGSIEGNVAFNGRGGGIYSERSTVDLNGGDIARNIANLGGGIFSNRGTVNLNNGSISRNMAIRDGGGIYSYYGTIFGNEGLVRRNIPNDIVKYPSPDVPLELNGIYRRAIFQRSSYGFGVRQTPSPLF